MKRLVWIVSYGLLFFGLAGCATIKQITQPSAKVDHTLSAVAVPAYSGPKARITLADFEVKAAKASSEIGSGLREMLTTVLVNTQRFSVVERQLSADLIITGAVTEFEPQASGGRAGVGGGGGAGSGVLGGLLDAVLNKAHLVLDVRVIDAATSEVLAANRIQGEASDISGAIMAGILNNLRGGLSLYANTPMEKAIRICIIEAVRYFAGAIPPKYFKYDGKT